MFNKRLEDKVRAYTDKLFAGVGESQQLFDLKEELAINIKEKTADNETKGMDEEQAFREAVISMGDLSGLIDDMRKLGQDKARRAVYSSITTRISIAGIIAGVLLILFGLFTSAMLYLMEDPGITATAVTGSGIFVVVGGALLTYSILTRETDKKYAVNKFRAALYALSIGLFLFGIFTSTVTYFEVAESFIPVASLMIFFLPAVGLFLYLILTERDRRKEN
jgi:hypothetical protein